MSQSPFRILFAVYPGMTQLDFTGPHQLLSRMPGSRTIVASSIGGAVASEGLVFADTCWLSGVSGCDLLCVPGGLNALDVALDNTFIGEIRRLGGGARYVTSVCTGSLILGAAGLLHSKRAACHWAWRHLLPLFGAIPDEGRVVQDGCVFTGGGVTAGIDFALTVLAEIAGEKVAQTLQLGLEYAPEPPFIAGRPETAPPNILAGYRGQIAPLLAQREAQAREAAARLSTIS
ncbi:thiamine biosynthesis protein ThiJ [Gluconobacter oxydans]|uniref:DJ-1/PfpI family protein n=1 Tax=Gluconobacter thailandicus TaxID=257438 RepID=UPI0002998855|nr:DJ-1/PfpI family protein [Gluconobacter thailandicus]AFW02892.1 ThiJ/PfpI domain-containing protein [Gluconobacter oxydans H24]ANQ41691.1 thiamine biosynthesis protein ThiJ [Gluconobacter oxydans]